MPEIPHKNHREEVLKFTEDSCIEELADIREIIDALFRIRGFEDDVLRVQER